MASEGSARVDMFRNYIERLASVGDNQRLPCQ